MLLRLDALNNGGNLPFRVDDKRGALDAHVLFAVHAFLFQHSEFDGHGFFHVAQQGEGQVVFFPEFLLGRGFVGGNAENDGPGAGELSMIVTEPGRFRRSTRGVGFRIKKQNDVFSAIIF